MGKIRGEHMAIVGVIGDTHCPGMRPGYIARSGYMSAVDAANFYLKSVRGVK